MSIDTLVMRAKLIDAILSNPKIKNAALIEMTGATLSQVQAAKAELKYAVEARIDDLIGMYQRLLIESIPLERRAEVYERIISGDDPHAAIKALTAIDKLGGLVTDKVEHTGKDGEPIKVQVEFVGTAAK